MKYSDDFRRTVQEDFKAGMPVNEAVLKYGISPYFANLWKRAVVADGAAAQPERIRKKYGRQASRIAAGVEDAIGRRMSREEAAAISDRTWLAVGECIRTGLYEMAAAVESRG